MGCSRPGVVGFSFSGFCLILSEAFEGRLPRPRRMVDGKLFCCCKTDFEGNVNFGTNKEIDSCVKRAL